MLRNLDAPRRVRLRSADRRRRRHPGADPGRVPAREAARDAASRCPRRATTASAWSSCRATCEQRNECQQLFEKVIREEGQRPARLAPRAGRRRGRRPAGARSAMPEIRQVFIGAAPSITTQDALERKLYVIRKRVEQTGPRRPGCRDSERFYVPSLSSRTIVYKGLLLPEQMPALLPRPDRPDVRLARWRWCTSASAPTRSRRGTAPIPTASSRHNGEINTLRGNVNWMRARQAMFASPLFGDDVQKLFPIIDAGDQRLGQLRQRARAARAHRPLAAARRDDDDPRGVAEPREHERREAGVLRVPRLPDGAVGRPGVDRLHRRHA